MFTNETYSKLQEIHLGTMARQFKAQLEDPQYSSMSFEDLFDLLVDAEWAARKSNNLRKLIRSTGFAVPSARVEDVEYLPERGLNKDQILRLASCAYIQEAHNVIFLGATGAGNTYLACALGNAACSTC